MAKITISSIAIENFGPFHVRQIVDLRISADRPVILVKALNGSGKTTLLTALQIGLYGHKALGSIRRSEYEQLILRLHRNDAQNNAAIEIGVLTEISGRCRELIVRREWIRKADSLLEELSVFENGIQDLDFSQNWDEFITSILPAELVQLFLFDGEKIEALANPERLPDLLKRATEAFLGIGGIESLNNDLKALERRTALKHRSSSSEYENIQTNLITWGTQVKELEEKLLFLLQEQASARNDVDHAQTVLNKFITEAQRQGLVAYEQAAAIRNTAIDSKQTAGAARRELAEAISDPVLPIAWLSILWPNYHKAWEDHKHAQHAKLLGQEFKKRDSRVLAELSSLISNSAIETVRQTLSNDLLAYRSAKKAGSIPLLDAPPIVFEQELERSKARLKMAHSVWMKAETKLDRAEQKIGQVPAEEQISAILSSLQEHSKNAASAEARLSSLTDSIEESQSRLEYMKSKLNAAQDRLGTELRNHSLDAKSLDASGRARKVLIAFKERLLASKAQWLSTMITAEFRALLHKRNLISKVIVDPSTYRVHIEDNKQHELPMDRLSAGERQLLAIAVLSALIKERKGRFPVVVDTPLARLDQQHRTSLIKQFFATVSHQVVVLSTDQEVEGLAHRILKQYTNAEYYLEFNDVTRSTMIHQLPAQESM